MSNRELPVSTGFPYTRNEFVMWLQEQRQDREFPWGEYGSCLLAEALVLRCQEPVEVGRYTATIGGRIVGLPDWLPRDHDSDDDGVLETVYPLTPANVLRAMKVGV